MTNYRDNVQRLYNGRLLAYIKAEGGEGDVEVKFSAPWLRSSTVSLKIKSGKQ
jgi:hypothetical protein